MVTYLPISSPFIRFAGRYVDEAFGVAAGYNFFVFEAALVPFEIVACNVVIHYWSDIVPAGGIIAIIILSYAYVTLHALRATDGHLACAKRSKHVPSGTKLTINDRLINVFAVKWYGESEFWLALGKVILIVGLLFYTYVCLIYCQM